MMNRRFDQDRPACAIRTESGGDLALDRRCSISFKLPSTCSRRDFLAAAGALSAGACRSGSGAGHHSPGVAPPFVRPRGSDRRRPRRCPPKEAAARKNRAIICMLASLSVSDLIGSRSRPHPARGEALLLAVIARPIPETRAADAGRAVVAD